MDMRVTESAARRIVEAGTVRTLREGQDFRLAPNTWRKEESEWRCILENDGGSVVMPGDMVGVHALSDSDYASRDVLDEWKKNGVVRVRAKRIGRIDDGNAGRLARAVSLDEIRPGYTGRGLMVDGFMSMVWRNPNDFSESDRFYTRADWISAASGNTEVRRLAFVRYPGDYTVIDTCRPDENSCFFSLLIKALPGHITAKVQEVDEESESLFLTCSVWAVLPLGLPAGKRLTDLIGKTTIVSRGYYNRRWEVIGVANF